jgi:hypothetical protein
MIPCTEFIPAYSELFKYLEARGGREAVLDLWNYLSDNFLHNLRDLVAADGIRGCWLYWSRTLNEEAADFTMELDEEAGEFSITMHRCPSKGMLLDLKHIEPYHELVQKHRKEIEEAAQAIELINSAHRMVQSTRPTDANLQLLWLHPLSDVMRLLKVAIGLGIVCISIGIAINIIKKKIELCIAFKSQDLENKLYTPKGVAFFNKVLYIADTGNNRIVRFKLSTDIN